MEKRNARNAYEGSKLVDASRQQVSSPRPRRQRRVLMQCVVRNHTRSSSWKSIRSNWRAHRRGNRKISLSNLSTSPSVRCVSCRMLRSISHKDGQSRRSFSSKSRLTSILQSIRIDRSKRNRKVDPPPRNGTARSRRPATHYDPLRRARSHRRRNPRDRISPPSRRPSNPSPRRRSPSQRTTARIRGCGSCYRHRRQRR